MPGARSPAVSLIDRDIHLARALLVEGNNMLRSVGSGQLRDAGIGQVVAVAKLREARMQLEQQRFDIVVCNREFEGSSESGQDLLDELRRERLLPHSTVFIMVTQHAVYHQVVEAAESALDGLLVRPYTAAALCQRIQEARHRKRELADVLKALDAGQTEAAFARALKRFQDQAPFAIWCGRLAAELLLDMQRPDDARRVFEKLHDLKPAPWALLGMGRARAAAGDIAAARRSLAEVLRLDPDCAEAHELQGQLLVEQGDFEGALLEYRAAAEITPGCLLRTQHAGALAFYQGQAAEARRWLEQSLSLGVQSKLFDALSLMLLALLRWDDKDSAGVAAAREQLRRYSERHPESRRLQRMAQAAAWLQQLSQDAAAAQAEWLALAAGVGDDSFDLEGANLLLSLWSRLPPALRTHADQLAAIERIALRFCVAKATAEVLAAAAQRAEPALGTIRRCQSEIQALAEQAMSQSLRGDAAGAVQRLLQQGEGLRNAKLLEMAAAIARRHAAVLPDAQAWIDRAAACMKDSCRVGTHIAGIQRSGRSPGGLQLRSRAATPVAA